jgi:predicted ATPase
MQLSCGDILAGRYEVERALGSGGMAEVWRVRHLELGSAHALKLLHRVGSPDLRRRLLEEGRAQAQLSHPNIVRVTDVVQLQGSLALVMELVEGPSLRDLLDEGRPPLAQAAALGAGLLAGVAHAHAAGFIHRDLKPENVLLTRAPPQIPRVADFGLVRALEAEASGRKLTREQVAMGTPGYMPPEQYRDAGRVDASADVFALGCVLYELLTGRRVFQGGDLIALYQSALREDFAPPGELAPELPPALCALVAAALSARPERRPSSAVALHAAWLAATGGARSEAPAAALKPSSTLTWIGAEVSASAAPLPQPEGAFFGRQRERERLAAMVREQPLVTLLGPGGTGKTRLALEVARDLEGAFPGGVWFCDLSEARDVVGAARGVARALDVALGGQPLEALDAALVGLGPALLVLDNFEQLAGCAAETAGRWRRSAPEVRLLVTSREVLRLAGERLLPLDPLPLHEGPPGDLEALERSPAAALFLDRARARQPDFALSAENASAVAALVGLLDGLPLAIELAAARAHVLSPEALVARLRERVGGGARQQGRFRVLRAGRADTAARQATLRGAIDWSWELLADWEKAAFAQLGVFEGGFTLEAAEAVLDLSQAAQDLWPEDAVQALVDKSLVRVGAGRFTMLVSLQEYAAEKLTGAERQATEARHGAWFASFGTASAVAALSRRGGRARWRALLADLDNLRAASRRAAARGDRVVACQAALAAREVYKQRGPYPEAVALLEGARETLGGAPPGLEVETPEAAQVLRTLALFYLLDGRHRESMAHLQDALRGLRRCGDRSGEGDALGNIAHLTLLMGDREAALRGWEAARAVLRDAGDRVEEANVLANLASLRASLGEVEASLADYEQARALYQATGHSAGEAHTLVGRASLRRRAGQLEAAGRDLDAAEALLDEGSQRPLQLAVSRGRAALLAARGRRAEARALLERALEIALELGNPQEVRVTRRQLEQLGDQPTRSPEK